MICICKSILHYIAKCVINYAHRINYELLSVFICLSYLSNPYQIYSHNNNTTVQNHANDNIQYNTKAIYRKNNKKLRNCANLLHFTTHLRFNVDLRMVKSYINNVTFVLLYRLVSAITANFVLVSLVIFDSFSCQNKNFVEASLCYFVRTSCFTALNMAKCF